MIIINDAVIEVTEQTVREIVAAIDEAKAKYTFDSNFKMSDGDIRTLTPNRDISAKSRREFLFKRGIIDVKSPYSKESFTIKLETESPGQESAGYRLVEE